MNIFQTFLLFSAFFYKDSSSATQNALSITNDQLERMAEGFCYQLFFRSMAAATFCIENFKKATEDNTILLKAPPARLLYRTKKMLTVGVPPSQKYNQVLTFVPKDNNNNASITAVFLQKNGTVTEIFAPYDGRIWSSYLDDESIPMGWTPGELAPNWTEPDKRPYIIEFERYFELKNNSGGLDVVFRWNSSDDTDLRFNVRNQCNNEIMGNMQIGSIKAGDRKIFLVKDLKFDDNCRITVDGKYGASTFEYKTPSCEVYLNACPPDKPVLYIVSERSDSGLGWNVMVSWDEPLHAPLRYIITVQANSNHSTTVPGYERSVTFPEVTGDRIVNVTVVAVGITNKVKAVTNEKAFLAPSEQSTTSIGVLVGGAWSGLLLAAVAAMLLYIWLQRRKKDKIWERYIPGHGYKASKDGSSTTFSTDVTITEDHWELRPDRLLLHEVIGEGAFGVVRRATLAPGLKEVAVKMLKEFPSVEEIRSFRCEMEVMKSVGAHPHVVSLVGCCSGNRPYIVAEYCNKGNLLNFLRCAWDIMSLKRTAKYYNNNIECGISYRDDPFKAKTHLEHSEIVVNKLYDLQKVCDMEITAVDLLSFCRQIAMGMEFLASNRVVHRDLAARNVLVASDKTLKIADFGLSRDVYQDNQYKQKGLGKLPIKWMALESLTQRIYTTQSDVWSFGVVIWEVVTVGGSPYTGVPASRLPRLLKAGYRMPKPTNCSKQLYDIMQSCWHSRPRERPTFGELHQAFDSLLNCACADEYLSLELDVEDAPPPPSITKYFSLLPRKNRHRCREESYERPLTATPQSNHYTSPPASQTRP